MYSEILIRYGEIGLKGKNRHVFVKQLVDNIKYALSDLEDFKMDKTYGRIYLRGIENDIEEMMKRMAKIPGIVSVSPVVKTDLEMDKMKEMALKVLEDALPEGGTCKVETTRANKQFPIASPDISKQVAGYIFANYEKDLAADMYNPEVTVFVEVRRRNTYIYSRVIEGPGGLPIGSGGRGLLLLSGGIDSPVAGWLGMKRGVTIDALHFYSFPFTSERSKEKVIDLTKILARYAGKVRLIVGHFTEIQKAIGVNCPERYHITIMRRMMFRMATEMAKRIDAKVLLTGESIGQVASQTLESMEVINAVTNLPVLRPVITMDKNEIIELSKEIDTYETSIQPYEDCCTVFVPESPVTRPKISVAEMGEEDLEIDKLINEAIEKSSMLIVTPEGVEAEYDIPEKK